MVLQHILGGYAVALRAVVGVHFVVSPLHDDPRTALEVWWVVD